MSNPEFPKSGAPAGAYKYGRRRAALNVRVGMAQKGFRNVAQLHRAMIALGYDGSHSQLTRIVENKSKMISLDVLDVLSNLFDCPAAALFVELSPTDDQPGQTAL